MDKERRYTVFLKPGRRALVFFRSPSESGQKLLMLDDQFWIVMPRSRRPMRITPTQKLLGEASSGDIATLTWSEDYKGIITGKTVVDDVPSLVLDLKATRATTLFLANPHRKKEDEPKDDASITLKIYQLQTSADLLCSDACTGSSDFFQHCRLQPIFSGR